MTSKKYPIYTVNSRTKEIEVREGWYCKESNGYRYAITRDPSSRRGYAAFDIWTGLLILRRDVTRTEMDQLVKDNMKRIEDAYRYFLDRQRLGDDAFGHHNEQLRSVIPEEAELPQGVYDYIHGDRPFTEVLNNAT